MCRAARVTDFFSDQRHVLIAERIDNMDDVVGALTGDDSKTAWDRAHQRVASGVIGVRAENLEPARDPPRVHASIHATETRKNEIKERLFGGYLVGTETTTDECRGKRCPSHG